MHKRKTFRAGFTIVELLIVVVVIANLAAISIVAFTSMQNRTHDSAVQSDLRQFGQVINLFHTEQDLYPISESQLATYGRVPISKDSYAEYFSGTSMVNYLYCYNNTTNDFGLVARSRSGNYFQYRDGFVSIYTAAATTSVTSMCSNIGVTYSGRIWLRDSAGAWQI